MGERVNMSLSEINDMFYETVVPEHLAVWKGCNNNTGDLSKHLSSVYVELYCSVIGKYAPNLACQNAVEETIYDVSGVPSCLSTGMNKYFFKKNIEEIKD